MSPASETILSHLPGSSDSERVLMVLCQDPSGGSCVELRQQSFAPGLGWFNQSTVELEASQVAALRNALGMASGAKQTQGERLPSAYRRVATSSWQPRVVHADSA